MSETISIPFNDGTIVGLICSGYKDTRYYSFQGIPYAEQPIGDLRFQAPVPIDTWSEVLDATKEASPCYQRHMIRFEEIEGSEDACI